MADVQIPIRLRRKTGEDALVFSGLQIFFNDLFNKIQAFFFAHVFLQLRCKNKGKKPQAVSYKRQAVPSQRFVLLMANSLKLIALFEYFQALADNAHTFMNLLFGNHQWRCKADLVAMRWFGQ